MSRMLVSILVPTRNRPSLLAEALESIAIQDLGAVAEVLVGDDSDDAHREANARVVRESQLAGRVRHIPHDPPKGQFQNLANLAGQARGTFVVILHDDDQLCPNAVSALVDACQKEKDERVAIWFGRNLIMNSQGHVDVELTRELDRLYGTDGPSAVKPVWQWCLTEAIPSNGYLTARETYLRHVLGSRDGNVGDWGFAVRLANSGALGSFLAQDVSRYRVQPDSITNSGRGVDVHRAYALAQQLNVPPQWIAAKQERFGIKAPVATMRHARDGERLEAWRCYLSGDWTWRQRLSARGMATAAVLMMPRWTWMWALRYR